MNKDIEKKKLGFGRVVLEPSDDGFAHSNRLYHILTNQIVRKERMK